MKQMMLRIRKKHFYVQPKNLFDLSNILPNIEEFKNILKGVVTLKGGTSLIFSSDKLLSHLNQQHEVYLDGTFKVFVISI